MRRRALAHFLAPSGVAIVVVAIAASGGPAAFAGVSPPAHPSTAASTGNVTPRGPLDATSIATSPNVTIVYGDSTSLSTTLTDTTTSSPIVGATVHLLSRADGPGFTEYADATTDGSGVAQITAIDPTYMTFYKWTYDGTPTQHAAMSSVNSVQVSQIVHVALTHHKVKHGKSTVVYGWVVPDENGKDVTLQRQVGGQWNSLSITAKLAPIKLPNGKTKTGYEMTYKAKKAGTYTLRVQSDDTRQNVGGISKTRTLTAT